ncbi:MAG: SRPBCC family protein [Armatimonadetes bacterium]|nr:SRPBCC family protein [Armatimonadota bacterium]MDE2205919.1 SRPBCC family protein [Armatimonadota bacterium]
MPHIDHSVEIEAPVAHVFATARDVEAFPAYMADLKSLTVIERSEDGARTVTEWVGMIREFNMTVKWVQEDLWDESRGCDTFRMLKGDMDSMSGKWQFTSLSPSRTRFDSSLDYEYNVPLIGAMVKSLIRKKMAENLSATMEAIQRKSEATRPVIE